MTRRVFEVASLLLTKTEQSRRCLKYACFTIILLVATVHLLSQISLFGDGSAFLLVLLEERTFFEPDPTRNYSVIITEAPVLLALKLGISSIKSLIYIQTFGLLFFTTSIWALSLKILRNDPFFWPFVLLVGVVYLNTSFFAIGESHIAYAITACCMAILLNRHRINLPRGLILVVLSFVVMRTYEALLFWDPCLV